jgi:hypothetical protein
VVRWQTLPGNHEASCRSIGSLLCDPRHDNFTAYRTRFHMPFAESHAVNSMWYSFDYQMAHFVAISTETDFPSAPEGPGSLWNAGPFGDQLSWLKADLEAANTPQARAERPWIIVLVCVRRCVVCVCVAHLAGVCGVVRWCCGVGSPSGVHHFEE